MDGRGASRVPDAAARRGPVSASQLSTAWTASAHAVGIVEGGTPLLPGNRGGTTLALSWGMKRLDLTLHLARLVGSLALLATVGPLHPALAVALSAGVYFASFAFTHDVAHGALRMSRRLTEWVLALAPLPMLVSGHAMRLMHLRHHARPLAVDDVEGVGAALSLWRAVLAGPANAVELRRQSWAAANPRERRWILGETVVGVALLVAALGSGMAVLRVWAGINVALQLTASAWASHLPHHPPRWARAIALRFAWTGSVTLLSFAIHEAHHARPKLPCRELA